VSFASEGLELRSLPAHNQRMSDPTNRPLSEWLADLEISEAQIAAGDFVPGENVLVDLRASVARLEAKRKNTQEPDISTAKWSGSGKDGDIK
jgi:hypothetical protein